MSNKETKVVLVERQGRIQTFNLPHEVYCAARGRCSCSQGTLRTTVQDKRTGERRVKPQRARVNASLTLLPRDQTPPLPAAVLECPEVQSALEHKPPRIAVKR